MINHDVIAWLLESPTPTIRFRTLVDLLGRAQDDPAVMTARRAIMTQGPVPHILAHQTETGQWPNEYSYYTPKYVSTHWSLWLLSEFDVDPDDDRFQRGVAYMLHATEATIRERAAHSRYDLACLWSNILRYIVHAGRLEDERAQAIVRYLVHDVRHGHCACQYNGGLACAWGVVRALCGLAAIPSAERSPDVSAALEHGLAFILRDFDLAAADYPFPPGGKIHPLWFRLNFPLFYQVDILFTLRVLHELGALDRPEAAPTLDWLASKRLKNGRWRGSSPYGGRTWPLGDRADTSRWVTLFALQLTGATQTAIVEAAAP